jgi:prepilin-type N-terminal cleavage/methylation domain-containing protein
MAARPRGPRSHRQAGFTLLETLCALAILSLALLLGMETILQQGRAVRRMESERQAFRALESTLEAVRAGVLPLQTAWMGGIATAVGTPAPPDLRIWLQVSPTPTFGLYEVTLQATYRVERWRYRKELRSMVYRP